MDSIQNTDFEELSQAAKGLERKAEEVQRAKQPRQKQSSRAEVLVTDIEGISYADLLSHLTKVEKAITSMYYGAQITPQGSEADYRTEIAKKEGASLLLGKRYQGKAISVEPKPLAKPSDSKASEKQVAQPQEVPGGKQPVQPTSMLPPTIPIYASQQTSSQPPQAYPSAPVMPYISTTPPVSKTTEPRPAEKQSLAEIARDIRRQVEEISPAQAQMHEGPGKAATQAGLTGEKKIDDIRTDYNKKIEQARRENAEKGTALESRLDDLKHKMESETSKKKLTDLQRQVDEISGQKKSLSKDYEARIEQMRRESEQKEAKALAQLEKLKRESQDAVEKARKEAMAQAQAEASTKAREESERIRAEYESRLLKAQEESKLKEKEIEKKMSALRSKLEEEASRKSQAETARKLESLEAEKHGIAEESSRKEQKLRAESEERVTLMNSQMEKLRRENEALQSKLKESAASAQARAAQSDEKLKGEISRMTEQMQTEMDLLRDTYEAKLAASGAEGIKHEHFQARLNQMNSSMKSELESARREYHDSLLKSPKDSRESSEELLAKLRTISEKNRALRDDLARQYDAESAREEQLAQEIQSGRGVQQYAGPGEEEEAQVPAQMQSSREVLPSQQKQGIFGGIMGGIFGGKPKQAPVRQKQEVASPQEGVVKSPAEQRRLIVEINNMDDITITNYAKQNMKDLYDNFNMGGITPGQFRFKVRERVAKERGLPPGIIASGLVRDQNPFEQISGKSDWGSRS